jgi:GSH-dependent disulfide-bond oxidoreductase
MILLYGNTSPNVMKVILLLEETGLEYELIWTNLWKGDHYMPAFIALNPNSKVPVIVDEDAGSVAVFESGAILIYLAEKTRQLLPQNERERSATFSWLMLQMSGVGPVFGNYAHFHQSASEDVPYAKQRFGTEARRLTQVLEKRLAHSPYLAGERYTIADIATFPWVRLQPSLGLPLDQYPNLVRWRDQIAARPAGARTTARWDQMMTRSLTLRELATHEEKERYYGRMPR